MGVRTASALAVAFIGLTIAGPANALVIGSADTNANDYVSLATTSGFSHTDAYGSVSYNSAFSSVGQIYGTTSAGGFAASGVLVAPGWVLTAGHVTSGASSLTFWLDNGGTNFSRAGGLTADRIVTNPYWTGQLSRGFDIGLVHLSTAVPCLASGACVTAKLASGTASPLSKNAVQVGYGMTGTGSTGANQFDGFKRAGSNTVDAYYYNGYNNILLADFDSGLAGDNPLGSSRPTAMESIIAPGDSGGGLFEDGLLVGITSFIGSVDGNPNSDFGDIAGWTNVASVYSWIESVIGGQTSSNRNFNIQLSLRLRSTSVEVPEPASLALFGVGLAGLALLRRRKPRD